MIRVAINGYGNLGRGVERALQQNPDMEAVVVFTRRDPATVLTLGTPVAQFSQLEDWVGKVDVVLNCGGSATDLQTQGPQVARLFNCVDSFDTHAKIPEHFAAMDEVAGEAGTLAMISAGWDPGLFSMLRLLGDAVLPEGRTATFWGPGVSQGHSDAVRRIPGVRDAKQYTVPVAETVAAVKEGRDIELSPRTMHKRVCYVVAEDDADLAAIEKAIVEMPNYFADYDTEVHFVSAEELARDHSGMPHGGQVIRSGLTGTGGADSPDPAAEPTQQAITFQLQLGSNPEFTGSVLVAAARAVYRMAERGRTGAVTFFDVPLGDFSPKSAQELRKDYL